MKPHRIALACLPFGSLEIAGAFCSFSGSVVLDWLQYRPTILEDLCEIPFGWQGDCRFATDLQRFRLYSMMQIWDYQEKIFEKRKRHAGKSTPNHV